MNRYILVLGALILGLTLIVSTFTTVEAIAATAATQASIPDVMNLTPLTTIDAITATEPTPGSYAVTVKGTLTNGLTVKHYSKLAMYSFQPDGMSLSGIIRQEFWIWDNRENLSFGNTSRLIGMPEPGAPLATDADKYIKGVNKFDYLPIDPTTLYGNWVRNDKTITITWSQGEWEVWDITWNDPSLFKIELKKTNYLSGSLYYQGSVRDVYAPNVGWGFGGPGLGFTTGKSVSESINYYYGEILHYNPWVATPVLGPVTRTNLALNTFHWTDQGILRLYYTVTSTSTSIITPVLQYFAKPINTTGILARRVIRQGGHDYDKDNNIANNVDHPYCGLQILDATGKVRGFVFAEASVNEKYPASGYGISALFYIDDASALDLPSAGSPVPVYLPFIIAK